MSLFEHQNIIGAAGAGGTYQVDNSAMFNDGDTEHLTRDGFGQSPTSSTVCTISVWVKRGTNFGSNSVIIYGGDPSGSTAESLRFGTGDQLQFSQASSDYDLKTTQVFRDPHAWYHIVAVLNTGAAETSRAALYVNGSQVTNFATANYPSSSYSTNFTANSSSVEHVIGSNAAAGNASQLFDGYIAELTFIDGQALTPTSFGEFDTNGIWKPKDVTGLTFGNNGFYLDFETAGSDLGDDKSGRGTDFTNTNSVTQSNDSPTKNFAVISPLAKHASSNALTNGNRILTSASNGWFGAAGSVGIRYGDKRYFEAKCLTNTRIYFGLSRIDSRDLRSDGAVEGSGNYDYMWRTTSADEIYYQGSNQSVTISAVSVNDIVSCTTETNGTVKFYKNGTLVHTFSTVLVAGDVYHPIFSVNGATSTEQVQANFGTGDVTQQESGYTLLEATDLYTNDPVTIADPSLYFQTAIYTTSTSAQDITFSGNSDLAPDWLWFKRRDNASDHFLFDKVRGVLKTISTNDTNAEVTSTGSLTAFGSDGFSLGDGGSDNDINGTSSATFAAWGWAAGGTSGSSNGDGSITSTVSANPTSGFSIIRWTGTGANGTIGHGLGVQPSLFIIKNTATTNSWLIGSTLYAATSYLSFNTDALATGDAAVFNSAHPTSSVINLGSNVGTNGSSGSNNMIGYAFAEIKGYSEFGVYTGNGNADGPLVELGFRPAWIMFKNISAAGYGWNIYDTVRETINPMQLAVAANSVPAEGNVATTKHDWLANGFKIKGTAGEVNGNTNTIVYLAFAENPFAGPAPATAR